MLQRPTITTNRRLVYRSKILYRDGLVLWFWERMLEGEELILVVVVTVPSRKHVVFVTHFISKYVHSRRALQDFRDSINTFSLR